MIRADRDLGNFLQKLDKSVGLSNVVLVLTSDHGAAGMPESVYPKPEAFRVSEVGTMRLMDSAMVSRYGRLPAGMRYFSWFKEGRLYFDYHTLEQKRIDKQEASDYITAVFENCVSGVFRTYTERELRAGGTGVDFVDGRIRRSYYKGISSDMVVVLKPFFIWDEDDKGADHLHPWTYDSHVPLILSGPSWIQQGRYTQRCSPIDIVPTVVVLVNCALPTGAEGRVLTEAMLH